MAIEIERKFLVNKNLLPKLTEGEKIVQGYIPTLSETAVRVRIAGKKAFLTIKGKNKGFTRSEFEYGIPVEDAESMIDELCLGNIVEKKRYKINYNSNIWEVDIFSGLNSGLVVAEIEILSENQEFDIPPWAESEVTGDKKFYNSNLSKKPFSLWSSNI